MARTRINTLTKKQVATLLIIWECETYRVNYQHLALWLYRIIIEDEDYEDVIPEVIKQKFDNLKDDEKIALKTILK